MEQYNMKFEYIEGMKSRLIYTVSQLVNTNPNIYLELEPECQDMDTTFLKLLNASTMNSVSKAYLEIKK